MSHTTFFFPKTLNSDCLEVIKNPNTHTKEKKLINSTNVINVSPILSLLEVLVKAFAPNPKQSQNSLQCLRDISKHWHGGDMYTHQCREQFISSVHPALLKCQQLFFFFKIVFVMFFCEQGSVPVHLFHSLKTFFW